MHKVILQKLFSQVQEGGLDVQYWVREKFGERFTRMWRLYLNSCAASFRYSGLDVHQILFTRGLNNNLAMTRDHIYT